MSTTAPIQKPDAEAKRPQPKDLGWRRIMNVAEGNYDRVHELVRSHVDAQADADLPRMRRLDGILAGMGWELVPEYGAAIYVAARERTARSEESFARFIAGFPEGSTVRAELEKHMAPPAAKSEQALRREHDAKAAQIERDRSH